MSAALGLYRLQQVDSQIDQIQARLKAIRDALENDLEIQSATQQFSAADNTYKDAQRALKQSEAEVEKQRIKIEQTEASLYGGRVHNPKELQDLQKDVDSLKRYLETLEERELEAMLVVEASESQSHSAKTLLEHVKASKGDQIESLTLENEALHKNLERLNTERQAVIRDIAQQAISTYDQLRQRRRGIAVVTLTDAACAACGTTLTPSQQQTARTTSQLFHCPSCGRILFAN
ncbi:MAG TPA: C4-type zinc ribbon domain-containing protein [Anaerolineales bacterium]|nr:C4-type zinc ribbon domain-containing protein [Anaerolineales bacterium]